MTRQMKRDPKVTVTLCSSKLVRQQVGINSSGGRQAVDMQNKLTRGPAVVDKQSTCKSVGIKPGGGRQTTGHNSLNGTLARGCKLARKEHTYQSRLRPLRWLPENDRTRGSPLLIYRAVRHGGMGGVSLRARNKLRLSPLQQCPPGVHAAA